VRCSSFHLPSRLIFCIFASYLINIHQSIPPSPHHTIHPNRNGHPPLLQFTKALMQCIHHQVEGTRNSSGITPKSQNARSSSSRNTFESLLSFVTSLSDVQRCQLGLNALQDVRIGCWFDFYGRRSRTIGTSWVLASDAFQWWSICLCFSFFRVRVRYRREDLVTFVTGVLYGVLRYRLMGHRQDIRRGISSSWLDPLGSLYSGCVRNSSSSLLL